MTSARCTSWMVPVLTAAAMLLMAGCPQQTTPAEQGTGGAGPVDQTHASLANHVPVADAGTDQVATAGQEVVLNAMASTDQDGDRLIYYWTEIDDNEPVTLSSPFTAITRFTAPTGITAPLELKFRLIVSDGFAFASADTTVTVNPPP